MVSCIISVFAVFLRQLGFFSWAYSSDFSISLWKMSTSSFFNFGLFHAAFAICLNVPHTSIFPNDSSLSGSFLSEVLDGHSTWTLKLDCLRFKSFLSLQSSAVHISSVLLFFLTGDRGISGKGIVCVSFNGDGEKRSDFFALVWLVGDVKSVFLFSLITSWFLLRNVSMSCTLFNRFLRFLSLSVHWRQTYELILTTQMFWFPIEHWKCFFSPQKDIFRAFFSIVRWHTLQFGSAKSI